ncbi:MAG: hypothetical protein J7J30_02505 [Candidatus Odinarchaeota archaeon]|nr:hypothetical protein [Candidatus Odinarchaeota archaeon]
MDMFGYRNEQKDSATLNSLVLKSFESEFTYKDSIFDELLRVLVKVCKHRLTEKQKRVLLHLYEVKYENFTFSKLALNLSKKLKMPLSTVKCVLRTLRECGLILAGNQYNKGRLARLSPIGEIVAQELYGGT